jgi:hydrogenase nickel incorporation protein HypA/HybF
MHDSSVIQAICCKVEQIAQENGARKVTRIVLEVGDLSHFTEDHMQDTFRIFREGHPVLREAKLEIRSSGSVDDVYLRDVELELPDE